MNTFLFLVCSIAILNTSLCQTTGDDEDYGSSTSGPTSSYNTTSPAAYISKVSEVVKNFRSTVRVTQNQGPPVSDSNTPKGFTFKDLSTAYMVAGGLILLSFLLLISTLLLAYKVCRLNRRIKELSSDSDLVVTTEYQGVKGKSEKDVEETTVLMSDLGQTKEEMGNGTAKEEGESKVEDGDKNQSEDAAAPPAAAAESSSPSKEPEETRESPSAEATAASNSEGPEEPKDVV